MTITNVGTTTSSSREVSLTGTNSANFVVNGDDAAPCGNTATTPLLPGKLPARSRCTLIRPRLARRRRATRCSTTASAARRALPLAGRGSKGELSCLDCFYNSGRRTSSPAAFLFSESELPDGRTASTANLMERRDRWRANGWLVAPGRVELPTFGLGNRCSIHLSYGATHAAQLSHGS